jgi:hypothetical protein
LLAINHAPHARGAIFPLQRSIIMMKQRFLLAAAALSLGFTALPAFAQSPGGDATRGASEAMKKCNDLAGAAREACLKGEISPTPATPGRSEDSASRTGVPPGQVNKDLPAPAAGGAPKDKGPQN